MISNKTKEILSYYGISLKKSLGQNFLKDPFVLEKIVEISELNEQSGVIEIGPGIGSLTEKLMDAAKKVVAIEIDERLVDVLGHLFKGKENVVVVNEDILKVNVQELIRTHFKGIEDIHVVANLPYYITSPILVRLLEGRYHFKNMVIMVQKEVSDRLTARPGTKAYGSLTVFTEYFAVVKEAMRVPSNVFIPPPKVESSIVTFQMRESPCVLVEDEALFFKIVRAAFAQRRKTLLNTLYANLPVGSKDELKACLIQIGIDPMRRGETLSIEEFSLLTKAISNLEG